MTKPSEPTNGELEVTFGVSRRTIQRTRHRPDCPRAADYATRGEFLEAFAVFAAQVSPLRAFRSLVSEEGEVTALAVTPPLCDTDAPGDASTTGGAKRLMPKPTTDATSDAPERATAPARPLSCPSRLDRSADGENGPSAPSDAPVDGVPEALYGFAAVRQLADNLTDTLHVRVSLSHPTPGEGSRPALLALVEAGVTATLGSLEGVLTRDDWHRARTEVWAAARRGGFCGEWPLSQG